MKLLAKILGGIMALCLIALVAIVHYQNAKSNEQKTAAAREARWKKKEDEPEPEPEPQPKETSNEKEVQ